jgi:hypothetical protein
MTPSPSEPRCAYPGCGHREAEPEDSAEEAKAYGLHWIHHPPPYGPSPRCDPDEYNPICHAFVPPPPKSEGVSP